MLVQRPRAQGFTLVELLVVIAIIGILAGFLLPALNRARIDARMGKSRADLRGLADACDAYFSATGTYPPMGNDWVRVSADGVTAMGPGSSPGRHVENGYVFFSCEDVGSDGVGPWFWNGTTWVPHFTANGAPSDYPGPDADGSEGNLKLDSGEDLGFDLQAGTSDEGEGNGRLDGTFYSRLQALDASGRAGIEDEWGESGQLYRYYAGLNNGPPRYDGATAADAWALLRTAQPVYTSCVVFSVGPDASASGLNNFYTVTQRDEGTRGDDNYRGDPTDADGDGILFERSHDTELTAQSGDLVFDYDVRQDRLAQGPDLNFALPGPPRNGDGVIMVLRGD